jgi:acetyl-CoA carboxylase biotin carboxyl carrier protein
MNLKELKELIDLFTARETIEEFEIEKSGVRLKMKRHTAQAAPAFTSGPVAHVPAMPALAALPAGDAGAPGQAPAHPAVADNLFYVKAPIVGTFYKSPNPTSPPFVNVGDFVEKGTVLCIVEAMKLMNEIEAEVAGQVTAVFVENGNPVEYGERLLAIKRN